MRTIQEIFNQVVTHLRQQGKPARVVNEQCKYKTKEGLKCAVGCLIPDILYDSSFEGVGVNYLIIKPAFPSCLQEEFAQPGVLDLLRLLQDVHDRISLNNSSWLELQEIRWQEIAQQYNLTIPPKENNL